MLATTERQGKLVVQPSVTRLDAAQVPAFRTGMAALVEQGHKDIVLDLAKVQFMDSSGLGALVSVLKMLGGPDSLAIAGACPAVLKLVKLTRLDRVFRLYDSVDQAVSG